MKKILLSLAVVFGMQAGAQTIDTIVTIDTTTTIDTVTTVDTVMLVNKTDSTVVSIPISEIDSVTFDDDTITNYNFTYTYDTTVTYDTIYNPCNGLSSITYHGYAYDLVEIGNQCWFKENLRTAMYRDTTPINYPGTDNTAWSNDTIGAYAWYNNDSTTHDSIYGKLYNWYAVDNPTGLCPTGWHVPSDSAWTVLGSYLEANGYNYDGSLTGNKYGKAMADSVGWNSSTVTGAVGNTDYPTYRNKSGFSGLPGGGRKFDGTNSCGMACYTYKKGFRAHWWTSSQFSASSARRLYMYNVTSWGASISNSPKEEGRSVRCLKD